MTITAGTRFGRYQIRSKIGEGGMGEVYRAQDTELGREVAIKVLPADFSRDTNRINRFRQEAQALARLNHPNILSVLDVGSHDGTLFVVGELLEGQTLRDRLQLGGLSGRKALDYALQMTHGLAAAHAKGITHRDLKPENLFLTNDGRVKILDFGLAKLSQTKAEIDTQAPTMRVKTDPDRVMGTVAYMSPEQVRGQSSTVDHRADIFAFGTVLYEMLTGSRAFKGETAADTMSAILNNDPPDITATSHNLWPVLDRIIRRCLEKRPEERFQSACDVGYAIEALSGVSGTSQSALTVEPLTRKRSWRMLPALVVSALVILVIGLVAGVFVGKRSVPTSLPKFQRLTFRLGNIQSARFAPDGQTIIYSALWQGDSPQLYSTRPETSESRPLGLPDARILAISSLGEMAILLHPSWPSAFSKGTLARMPITGGAPREILENVVAADWSPDGKQLAVVVRDVGGGRNRLEFPIGKTLYESTRWLAGPRFSPKGDMIAFFDGDTIGVVNLAGDKKVLSSGSSTPDPYIAWSPSGDEIWFGASKIAYNSPIYAVNLSGQQRLIALIPDQLVVEDIARDGRVLLLRGYNRKGMFCLPPGETKEHDLSWLDWAHVADISADGKTVLFTEGGERGGASNAVYLRKTDGSPAVRLSDGTAQMLSPDGKWALSILHTSSTTALILLPTGAGESKQLTDDQFKCNAASWFPDGGHILLVASEQGSGVRDYILDIDGGKPRPITPEGIRGRLISPDGQRIIVSDNQRQLFTFSVGSGEQRPIPGIVAGDQPIQWGADGRSIYVRRNLEGTDRVQVSRLDLSTGHKELWKEFVLDPFRVAEVLPIVLTPDGKSYAYTYGRFLSDLYLVTGLK